MITQAFIGPPPAPAASDITPLAQLIIGASVMGFAVLALIVIVITLAMTRKAMTLGGWLVITISGVALMGAVIAGRAML